jgi:hypothetical protein
MTQQMLAEKKSNTGVKFEAHPLTLNPPRAQQPDPPSLTRLRGFCRLQRRIASADFFWAYALPGALSYAANFPCAQSGAVAPFPREAGAAAGLLGFFTMVVALVTGTWVGMSHNGTLLPLALTSAVIGTLLFGSAWILRHQRAASPG